jgi:hypothetical protein
VTLFPRRQSIRTRLALIYTALLAAALIAFGSSVFLVLRGELQRSFEAGLLANAEHAAGALGQDVDATGRLRVSERLVEQFASTGGRVVVLDPAGAVLADSAPPNEPPPSLSTAELALVEAHGRLLREVGEDNDVVLLTVVPITAHGGEGLGYVRLG